jgi:Tol biopolymer transport system component/DNA-binding winged helix-turn-helix (wHTH) protein
MTREAGSSWRFGTFQLDVSERRLLDDGQPVPLTPKVFDLLRLLVENNGHLVTKDRFLREVWPDTFVEEANLNRAISVLRKALRDGIAGQRYIETVPKLGYRFVAAVAPAHLVIDPGPTVANGRVVRLRRMAVVAGAALSAAGALVYSVVASRFTGKSEAVTRAVVHRQATFTGKGGSSTVSPDGRRIAYVSYESPERTVMVQAVAGGAPAMVFSAPETARPRWSPDGSALMVWARGAGKDGLYVLPQPDGTPHLIARGQFVGCWSPDGLTIAVAQYFLGRIAFVSTLRGDRRTVSLKAVHRWIWDMDWSSVNNQLVFASSDDQGQFSIWTMRPDGSDQQRVFFGDNQEISAVRWAPQAKGIYYSRRVNQTVSLNKILRRSAGNAWDSVAVPLLTGLETDGSFAVSADGKSLVYVRASFSSNLWLVEPNGSSTRVPAVVTRELTRGTSVIERPRVSPDGNRIAFNVGHESVANVYVMPITGGSPTQLTFLNSFNADPVWSPDGNWVAFASTEGGKPRVWVVSADGGPPHAVSSGDLSADNLELAWAPSSRILYQQVGNRNFYALDPQTNQEHLLVRDSSVGWMFSPVHAPDRKAIAVAWNRRPKRGIWIIDGEDSREGLLYEAAVPPVVIGWSADGRSVFALEGGRPIYRGLIASRGETLTEAKIVRISARDGESHSVMALPFAEVGGVSMTPDGRRFVCTVYSSRSDVWLVDNFDPSPQS